MIFRLKFLIPILLLLATLVFTVMSLKDARVRSWLESYVPGLHLENFDLHWSSSRVGLSTKGILKDPKNQDKLLSWESADGFAYTRALGFKKIEMPEAEIKGVYVTSKLFSSLSEQVKDTMSSGNAEEGDSGLPMFDFKNLNHEDILERLTGTRKLRSEVKLEELKNTYDEISKKWLDKDTEVKAQIKAKGDKVEEFKSRYAKTQIKTDYQNEIADLKGKVEALKQQKFDLQNVAEIQKSLQDIQQFKDKVQGIKSQVQQTKETLDKDIKFVRETKDELVSLKDTYKDSKSDIERLTQGAKDVRQAGDEDLEMLKRELDPKNFDAAKITRLLFGKEWEEKFIYYSELWFAIREYLPSLGKGAPAVTKEEKEQIKRWFKNDQPVVYPRNPDYAGFTLHQLKIAGRGDQLAEGENVEFASKFSNITTDEAILRKPFRWDVDGTLGNNNGKVLLAGQYSLLDTTSNGRKMNVVLGGRSMSGKQWGSDKAGVVFKNGTLSANIAFDLSQGEEIPGRGEISIAGFEIQPTHGVSDSIRQPLVDAVSKVLAKPISFEVILRYKKIPKLKFGGEMDDTLKDALTSGFKMAAQEQGQLLTQKFQGKLESQLAGSAGVEKLNTLLAGYGGGAGQSVEQILSSLLGAEKDQQDKFQLLNASQEQLGALNGDLDGLGNARNNLQNELKKRAEDEAKKRIMDEAKKKLLGGGGTENSQDSKGNENSSSDSGKNILQDKLKKIKL